MVAMGRCWVLLTHSGLFIAAVVPNHRY
jgi:hypothetical protein